MSTMISLSDAKSNRILSDDDIRAICPVAFKTTPTNPKVSDKYVQATTIDVIHDMAKLGWYPVEAKQCKRRKNSNGIYSFHMIAFENDNVRIMRGNDTEAMVRVILTNSHDGCNSFKFMCGIYRFICSNGLVVSDLEFEHVSIRHINYDFNELKNTIVAMVDRLPEVIWKMNKMTAVELTNEQKMEFAEAAYRIRYMLSDTQKVDRNIISDILTPKRPEDNKNDLWTVFNICQEKIINGGFYSNTKSGKLRRQRSITQIKKNLDINQQLWDVSRKYIPLAA